MNFTLKQKDDDFCLIHTNTNIINYAKKMVNVNLMSICLPESEVKSLNGNVSCFTSGERKWLNEEYWDYRRNDPIVPLNLLKPEKCEYTHLMDETKLCAGIQDHKTGNIKAYKGNLESNYGAALFCYDLKNKTPVLVGIAAKNHLSPQPNNPGIYTDVFKIKSKIQKQFCKYNDNV